VAIDDTNVAKFPRRRRALSNRDALAFLGEKASVEVSSFWALGDLLGWERSRTSKAVIEHSARAFSDHSVTVHRISASVKCCPPATQGVSSIASSAGATRARELAQELHSLAHRLQGDRAAEGGHDDPQRRRT
jgi:hypothetical protein